jgi:8-oxo-dGTP diphosphatase
LGKRKNAHGAYTWSPPGGHLEFGESFEACAEREVLEETGLSIKNIRRYRITNDIFDKEDKHYVTLIMAADYTAGVPQLLEPHKCYVWQWFALDQLPDNLFLSMKNMMKDYNVAELSTVPLS